ncbi:MAG TPA: hypothetical protein VMF86_18170 [Stellaceae bacterium]|nr:hypothetical protein [Stellaceae bacterium]
MAEIEVQRQLLDDIREFISEKWKHSECELCETDRWMVYPEPTTHIYLSVADERGPPQTSVHPTVAFIPASCINCGNLRLIDARTFEKWRAAKATDVAK